MTWTLVMLIGYFLWPWVSRRRNGRFVLLATTLGMTFYPALSAATPQINWIILFAGITGLFQAGLDLVFFDELMKTVPAEHSAVCLWRSRCNIFSMITCTFVEPAGGLYWFRECIVAECWFRLFDLLFLRLTSVADYSGAEHAPDNRISSAGRSRMTKTLGGQSSVTSGSITRQAS
jgi:hypothetical protein